MQTREFELGYFAAPSPQSGTPLEVSSQAETYPGVVILHDVWGLYDHYRDLARRFAEAGFVALSLDLYRREAKVKIDDPGGWIRELSDPAVQADVEAGVAFLAGEDATQGHQIGVVGFCMGGMYALLAGCAPATSAGARVSAVVPFYGLLSHEHGLLYTESGLDPKLKPRSPLEAAADLRCPLLAFFGADDPYIPTADVSELEQRLAPTQQPFEVVVYPDAGHAFMNDTRAEAYRPEAAHDAWDRMLSFLRLHLA